MLHASVVELGIWVALKLESPDFLVSTHLVVSSETTTLRPFAVAMDVPLAA
jgi:hypothetical protein